MNAKLLVSALVAAAGFVAVSSFAADHSGEVGYIPPVSVGTSDVTRAEVRADVLQAQRAGTLPVGGEGTDVGALAEAATGSTLSRAAVRAEAVHAVHNGLVHGGEV